MLSQSLEGPSSHAIACLFFKDNLSNLFIHHEKMKKIIFTEQMHTCISQQKGQRQVQQSNIPFLYSPELIILHYNSNWQYCQEQVSGEIEFGDCKFCIGQVQKNSLLNL